MDCSLPKGNVVNSFPRGKIRDNKYTNLTQTDVTLEAIVGRKVKYPSCFLIKSVETTFSPPLQVRE